MKIQRFEGKDAQEALRLAQLALGPDALILQTRRVQPTGIKGLVGKTRVEVLAAVDTEERRGAAPPARGSETGEPRVRTSASEAWMHRAADSVGGQSPGRERGSEAPPRRGASDVSRSVLSSPSLPGDRPGTHAERGCAMSAARPERGSPVSLPPSGAPAPPAWQAELMALRCEMANLRWQLQQARQPPAAGAREPADATEMREHPIAAEDPGRPAGGVSSEVTADGPRGPATPMEDLAERVAARLATRPIELRDGVCIAVALVGPTGVGKTTTLAKLAAAATLMERRRVAFITVDTYRLGAVEQLETYARLLEIPLSVAYSVEDVRAARDRFADYDLVFLDTVGRSPRNTPQLQEMAALLEVARPDEVHLVMDAGGSYATHECVLDGFRVLRPTHLLLSKLDEAPRLEDSLAAVLGEGIPLSYITTGQRVPEDLAPANSAELAGWLLGGR